MPSEREIWIVLQKIKKLSRIPAGRLVRYPLPYAPNKDRHHLHSAAEGSTLYQLEDEGVFEIHSHEMIKEDVATKKGIEEQTTQVFYLRILPKFKEVYEEYQTRFSGQLKKGGTSIFFTPQGELFRYEGDERLSYPMRENGVRRNIIDTLIDCTDHVQAKDIAAEIGTSKTNVKKEIGGIRTQVAKRLYIDGKEFIKAKYGSGYALGYRIKRVKK